MGDEPRPEEAIGLAELIVAVRDELERVDAARLDRNDDALLELREVELELQFAVRRARSGRGGLDFQILSAGARPPDPAPPLAPQTQRLRVLYGPAFKLVELDEGEPDGLPDWLRAPVPNPAHHPDPPTRLQIDDHHPDDLANLHDLGLDRATDHPPTDHQTDRPWPPGSSTPTSQDRAAHDSDADLANLHDPD